MGGDHRNEKYRRTVSVLNKKYIHYMIPAMLSAVGISLSEFADSMLVSHLLSSDAFAIINLGTPIVFAVSLIYTVAGLGGSLLFAECLGKKDKEKDLFGCLEELRTEFDAYTRVLGIFVPVGILLMHVTYFLPIVGKPFLSMGLVVSVNIFNIILDVVFILRFGKISLTLCKCQNAGRCVKEIVKKGLPSGSVQAGYLVTTVFCNHFMNLAFGLNGVIAMSLFAQMDSVISIALTGIVDNNASFAAMLKGEGDYYGIRDLLHCAGIRETGAGS